MCQWQISFIFLKIRLGSRLSCATNPTNYKEGVGRSHDLVAEWNHHHCKMSLLLSDLYYAGGQWLRDNKLVKRS